MNNYKNSDMEDDVDLLSICSSFRDDIKRILKTALELSTAVTDKQFLSELIGECPQCGSNHTRDCENVEHIKDFTVGLCIKCGYVWCIECGRPLAKNTTCSHWEICRKCDITDKSGFCGTNLMECKKLNNRQEGEDR